MKIIDERQFQNTTTAKQTKTKRSKGNRRDSERMRAKLFDFLQLICKASLIFKANLESALSIILKQRALYGSKDVAVEWRCLKISDLLFFFDMLLNLSFKITARFPNIARTTASKSKFIY